MFGDRDTIYNKFRGLGERFIGFNKFLNISSTEKSVDRVHRSTVRWTHGVAGSTVDQRTVAKEDEEVPEGFPLEHKWRQRGGVTMAARARHESEGGRERELESEGERCGVLQGWSIPFIGAEGAPGRR
jgi:hypothetical protein